MCNPLTHCCCLLPCPSPHACSQDSPEALNKALRWTYITGGALTLILIVAWPLLALPAGVFSQGYFTMWIIIAMIWGLLAAVACIFVPIYESAAHVGVIFKNMVTCHSPQAEGKLPAETEVKSVE
jgi:hypothetical protein